MSMRVRLCGSLLSQQELLMRYITWPNSERMSSVVT